MILFISSISDCKIKCFFLSAKGFKIFVRNNVKLLCTNASLFVPGCSLWL